jgi:GDPmannose 4,6-dehydratase
VSTNTQRVALITGITGQDGTYLAECLSTRGYRVIGTTRNLRSTADAIASDLSKSIELTEWDLIDKDRFSGILELYNPTEIYNFAAFSSGEHMDRDPEAVTEINGLAVIKMLDAIKQSGAPIRFCQASSSEVFAGTSLSPQSEETPRVPRSVYGAAKILADNIVKLYREKYGLFCCSAFLFNHESPLRGEGFVTTKVVRAAVQIKAGRQDKLLLGNLSAARDWGFAGDYVRAMALMLDALNPADYVIATGKAHTVADLCAHAFTALSLDYRDHVETDPRFYRPNEPAPIIGDASRARTALGWSPTTSFEELVKMMVDAETVRR